MGRLLKTLRKILGLGLCLLLLPLEAQADVGQGYLVLGVIASDEPDQGVVLVKSRGGDKAFAVRVGQEFDQGVSVARVTRDFVYVSIRNASGSRTERLKVGEEVDLDASASYGADQTSRGDVQSTGLERHGNRVKVQAAYREDLVSRQLNKIMMQAAAVPHYENGALIGFRLWEIEPGSIYDQAGLANGDIITALNGQPMSDVGRAIKTLQSMRNETRIEVSFVRKGQPMTLEVVVE